MKFEHLKKDMLIGWNKPKGKGFDLVGKVIKVSKKEVTIFTFDDMNFVTYLKENISEKDFGIASKQDAINCLKYTAQSLEYNKTQTEKSLMLIEGNIMLTQKYIWEYSKYSK